MSQPTASPSSSGAGPPPTLDQVLTPYLKPLRMAVEEIHGLREMNQNNFKKETPAIRRILNAIDRVFTADAQGHDPGAFWSFLLIAQDQLENRSVAAAMISNIGGKLGMLQTKLAAAVDSASNRIQSGKHSNSQGPEGPVQGPAPSDKAAVAAQMKLASTVIESVRAMNMSNNLDALHFWIIRALCTPGAFVATLNAAVLPLPDVVQGFIGVRNPLFARQAAIAAHRDETQEGSVFCMQFIREFSSLLERLHFHPALGQIRYLVDVTALQLFQMSGPQGAVTVGSVGSDSMHRVQFTVPNALIPQRRRRRQPKSRSVSMQQPAPQGGPLRVIRYDIAVDTSDLPAPPPLADDDADTESGSPAPVQAQGAEGGAYSARRKPTSYFTDDKDPRKSARGMRPGELVLIEDRHQQTDELSQILTFAELCAMQNDILAQEERLKQQKEAVREQEADLAARAADQKERVDEVVDVLLKLKELYFKHVIGIREKQEMGLRVSAADLDRKIPELLSVLDDGDYDMVGESKGLSAAGVSAEMAGGAGSASQEPRIRALSRLDGTVVGGQKPLVTEDPNDSVAPQKKAGLMELKTAEPEERDRDQQLRLQNYLCADCGTTFGEASENRIFKAVQRTGEMLMFQKPRRCHYCTQLLCHSCHTNQTTALPFRGLLQWDFAPQHVCKRCYNFLHTNFELALYDLRTLPRSITNKPVVVRFAQLRTSLIRAALIVAGCSRPSSAGFAQDLNKHYFRREFFYSLSDLSQLARYERQTANPAHRAAQVPGVSNVVGVVAWATGQAADAALPERLAARLTEYRHHITTECTNCKARATMPCGICSSPQPVVVCDLDAAQCKKCHDIFHKHCLEVHGCPGCGAKHAR